MSKNAFLQIEHVLGSLLASLDTGLVIGVHVNQFCIQPHGPLKQGNDRAQSDSVEFVDGQCDRFAAIVGKGRARTVQESMKEISGWQARRLILPRGLGQPLLGAEHERPIGAAAVSLGHRHAGGAHIGTQQIFPVA